MIAFECFLENHQSSLGLIEKIKLIVEFIDVLVAMPGGLEQKATHFLKVLCQLEVDSPLAIGALKVFLKEFHTKHINSVSSS